MNNFALLKDVVLEMRELAYKKLDTLQEFKHLTPTEKELHIYSLFNHGLLSQSNFLLGVHGINVDELEEIKE